MSATTAPSGVSLFVYNTELYNFTRSCVIEAIALQGTKRLHTAPIRITVLEIPVLVHIGPFVHSSDLQQAYAYASQTANGQFIVGKKTSGKTLPEAFQYPSLQGNYWLSVRALGSKMLNVDFYATVQKYCNDKLNLPNVTTVHTDTNVGEAWTRLMSFFALPGWLYNAPVQPNQTRYRVTWAEFENQWLVKHMEGASFEPCNIPSFRIAFIDMHSTYNAESTSAAIYEANWAVSSNTLYKLAPVTQEPEVLLAKQLHALKDYYNTSQRSADIYVYVVSPGDAYVLAHPSDKIRAETSHCQLIHSWAPQLSSLDGCMHFVWPTEHKLANDGTFSAGIKQVRADFDQWFQLGLLLARISGQPLTVTLDPTQSRTTRLSNGLLTRLLIKEGYSVLPDKAFRERFAPYGDDHKFTGGIFTTTPPLLRVNTQILLVDIKSCYPTSILTGRLCLTACSHWPALHSILPRDAHIIGQQIFDNHHTAQYQSTPLPPLCKLLQECLALRQQYQNTPLSLALKLIGNGLYGVLGSPYFRFFVPIIPAVTTDLARRILRSLPTGFDYTNTQYKLIMCATDSIFVELLDKNDSVARVQSEFCTWLKLQYQHVTVSFTHFTSLLVADVNHYAAINMHSTDPKVHVRGCPRDMPPAFNDLLQQFLMLVLTRTMTALPTDPLFESTLRQWLDDCKVPIVAPTIINNTKYHILMSQGQCRELHVRTSMPIYAPIVAIDNANPTQRFVPRESRTTNTPIHYKIADVAWREWYLRRYVCTIFALFCKVWSRPLVQRILCNYCNVSDSVVPLSAAQVVPPAAAAATLQTISEEPCENNTLLVAADTNYWDTITQIAGLTTNVAELFTPASWNMAFVCASCTFVHHYDPRDDNSRSEWRRRSQSGESALCPNCSKPLRGDFSNSADIAVPQFNIRSVSTDDWVKRFDEFSACLDAIADFTNQHPEAHPSLFVARDLASFDTLGASACAAAKTLSELRFLEKTCSQ